MPAKRRQPCNTLCSTQIYHKLYPIISRLFEHGRDAASLVYVGFYCCLHQSSGLWPIKLIFVERMNQTTHGETHQDKRTKRPCNKPPSDTYITAAARTQSRMPTIQATSRYQHRHSENSIVTLALFTRDDHPIPTVHLSIPIVAPGSSCISQRTNGPWRMCPLSAAMLF